MENGYWDIQGDILFIRCGDEIIIPAASEIFKFIFSEEKSIQGMKTENDPTQLEQKLIFSRYPVVPIIEINLLNDQKINLLIKIEIDNKAYPFDDFFQRNADHIIINDTWYPLVPGSYSDLKDILGKLGISNMGEITLKQYLLLRHIQDYKVYDLTPERMNAKGMAKSFDQIHKNTIFTGKLYPYQDEGYCWLSYINQQDVGCILADEMGLGKTIQVIALLADHAGSGKPNLVVAPATLLENWRREINKFAPGISTLIHQGPKRTGSAGELKFYDVIITSYETVTRDRYMLKMIIWNTIILDEAQAIKNPEAKRTKAVKMIPRRSAIAMSGTPVQNNLIDLWSISDFVLPGLLGTLKSFEKEYVMDIDSAERVEPMVSPIMLRRRVIDVAKDLPKKIEIPQVLVMDKKASEEYDEIRQQTVEEYGDQAAFVVLGKMRMFCAHPTLLSEIEEDPVDNSVKYCRLLEILEEIFLNNEKALIFTSWTKMIDILTSDLATRFNIYTNSIDGRVEISERQTIVDTFNNIDEPGVLILNPAAGGVGLNITGANHVIHYNLEWNPAVVDQATARAYRRGQKRPVTVHYLFYKDTVEEIINERLVFKREIGETAVIGVKGKDEDYEYILKALKCTPKTRI